MPKLEKTLLLLKPDAVRRRLCGRILARLEDKGLRLLGLKLINVGKRQAELHYAEHRGKHFYPGLIEFITSGPVLALCAEGVDAVRVCRTLAGATCGRDAAPGTIRGDFGQSGRLNLIHASDSPQSARRELGLYFKRGELVAYPDGDLDRFYDLSSGEPV